MTVIIGIDPSTVKMCAAISGPLGIDLQLDTCILMKDPLIRLNAITEWTMALIEKQPVTERIHVFLENPIVFRSATSTITLGQVSGACIAPLGWYPHVSLMMVNNSTWKKDVVGNGRAQKPEISRHLHDYWLNAWEACDRNQDLIDACCLNRYGANILRKSEALTREAAKPPKRLVIRK